MMISNEKFEAVLRELCELKRFAIKEGQNKNNPSEIYKRISVTNLTSGDVAEILISYMLGLFSVIADDNLRIYVTTSLDKGGADFCLKRFKQEFYIQMKFCKRNDRVYLPHIKVVELGACPDFTGLTQIAPMQGNVALYELLIQSGAYDEEEIYDIFEKCIEFEDICNEVWVHIKS